jgi:hypothetical protein
VSNAKPMLHHDRIDNYLRQNGISRNLTIAQERQLDRGDRRERRDHSRENYLPPASSGPVTLPDLGAIDPHSRMMIDFGYALQETGKHIYCGTVPYATKVRRRTANKRARAARRAGRR